MRRFAISILGFVFAFGTEAGAQEVSQTVRDWWVSCDYVALCVAEATAISEDNQTLALSLARGPEENSQITLTIIPELALSKDTRIEINVPGFTSGFYGVVGDGAAQNAAAFSLPTRGELVQDMRQGAEAVVNIELEGDAGTVAYRFSLAGVTDALLMMDVVQQRIGRMDAAVAWGGNAPTSISDIALPSEIVGPNTQGGHTEEGMSGSYRDLIYLKSDLPKQVLKHGADTEGCNLDDAIPAFGELVVRDELGRLTYLVACQTGDLNIAYYIVLHHPENGIIYALMAFEKPPELNMANQVIMINPEWMPAQNTMTFTTYNSPGGDCGVHEVHRYLPAETRFQLVEFRRKPSCDGDTTDPREYPVVWALGQSGPDYWPLDSG